MYEEKISLKNSIIIVLSYLVQGLLRADRVYSCIVIMIACITIQCIKMMRHKKSIRNTIVIIVAMLILCISTVKFVNSKTQKQGINGRIETGFAFVLLDRIVWPNMTLTYDKFPDDIKEVISLEEAQIFDTHNNNVMYQLAPLVEERVGKEKAEKIYIRMAKTVMKEHTGKVIYDISRDSLGFICMPISVIFTQFGLNSFSSPWNVTCMSSMTPKMTTFYNNYFLISFCCITMLFLLVILISNIRNRRHLELSSIFSVLGTLIGMSVTLALWFSIGDGAPPNDRYALIVYVTWVMLSAIVIGNYLFKGKKVDLE